MSNDAAPRILICRMSSLGDTVLTMPIACALREHFPQAHLAWLVERSSASMIRGHRALDEVIQLETGWSASLNELRKVSQALRGHEFDIMIDSEGTAGSGFLGWHAGIEHRIGYASPHSNFFNRCFTNDRVTPVFNHMTDRSLELLIPLGIHSPKVRWHLPIPASARTWATAWRRNSPSPKLAIVAPASDINCNHWDAANLAKLAHHLRQSYQYRCILTWTTDQEKHFANQIVEQSHNAASLAPHIDLQHLAALLEQSDLFINGDINPLHVSIAVGTPTINLHSTTQSQNCRTSHHLTFHSHGDPAMGYQHASGRRDHQLRRKASPSAITFERVCEHIDKLECGQQMLRAS